MAQFLLGLGQDEHQIKHQSDPLWIREQLKVAFNFNNPAVTIVAVWIIFAYGFGLINYDIIFAPIEIWKSFLTTHLV